MVSITFSNDNTSQRNHNRHYSRFKITEISCLRCGVCCRKYQPRLTADEITQLALQFGVSFPEFINQFTDHRWPGTQSFLLRQQNDACLFLEAPVKNRASMCHIQTFKPSCCRSWNADLNKPECQEGLKNRFNLVVDSRGRISGDQVDLEKFEKYVDSLIS
jgi:Fe-S-cluster containining protein